MAYRTIAAVMTLLFFIDGYDLFLLGRIAPAIAAGYGRAPADMALVFTWHQAGLAAGALLMPWLADRHGLRRMLLVMTAAITTGTIVSTLMPDLRSFAWARGATGIAIAGILPVGLALLTERVPRERLGTILSIALVGMSAGAAANGVAAAWLLDQYGWRSGLWLGAAMPLLALPLLIQFVPEAARFAGASPSAVRDRLRPTALFSGGLDRVTPILWATCFLTMAHTALVAAWLPTVFQQIGGISIQRFALVGMLSVFGGAAGTLGTGLLQDRFRALPVTIVAHLGNGAGLVLLGVTPFSSPAFPVLFVLWSLFQSGSITALNLLLARSYPAPIRASGIGVASAIGRVGGIMAPTAGALILGLGASLSVAMLWMAVPMFVAAAVVLPLLIGTRPALPTSPDGARHAG